MFLDRGSLRRLSARIGRWPRRLAALVCLLLAAGSALAPAPARPSARRSGLAAHLRPGEVAVPVPVTGAGADLVHVGDRVGVLAAADSSAPPPARAALVADHLRVLAVRTDPGGLSGDAGTVVVVAAARAAAVAIARFSGDRLLLIVDELP